MDWKKEYSVGIDELDSQHKTLVECVSAIEQAETEAERPSVVEAVLERLDDFTRVHFAVEECLMRIHDDPRLHEHIHEHLRFADRLRLLKLRSPGTDISQDIVEFLRRYLAQHVPDFDKSCAFHFLKRTAMGEA